MKREKKKISEKEYVIDKEVTENDTETNWVTLKEVIDECPDDLDENKKEQKTVIENLDEIHRDISEDKT